MDYRKVCENLLKTLSERQARVLERRFGLASEKTETLQKIGSDFGITRERVRQIEKEGLENLKKKTPNPVFIKIASYLKEKGGAKRENLMFKDLSSKENEFFLKMILTAGNFFYFKEDNDFYSFWATEKEIKEKIKQNVILAKKELKKRHNPLPGEVLFKLSSGPLFKSSLEITKEIEKGPLGKYGLSSWAEIKPKGVKDTAYLVLKREEKPLHFRKIAFCSNDICQKEVLPQTVHNELIRDPRFVLVGRGTYALKEWGYESGTVKEVISKVLEQKGPLSKEQVLEEVKKQRLVKDNTVCLNLADKSCFSKDSEGKYQVRMA